MKTRIKELRKALGLTQAEFGAKIGVTNAAVSGWELGHRIPAESVVLSICREFGCSRAWLRHGDGEMFIQRLRLENVIPFNDSDLLFRWHELTFESQIAVSHLIYLLGGDVCENTD